MINFNEGDALLIVDAQNDFMPNGALHVVDGDQIIEPVNQLVAKAHAAGIPIVFSRDWHPADNAGFKEFGGEWPPHCVQNTEGAAFHPDLEIPEEVIMVKKGYRSDYHPYSALQGVTMEGEKPLPELLKELNIKRLIIGGLAFDYCVKFSVEDAVKLGLKTHVVLAATKAIFPEKVNELIDNLESQGVVFE